MDAPYEGTRGSGGVDSGRDLTSSFFGPSRSGVTAGARPKLSGLKIRRNRRDTNRRPAICVERVESIEYTPRVTTHGRQFASESESKVRIILIYVEFDGYASATRSGLFPHASLRSTSCTRIATVRPLQICRPLRLGPRRAARAPQRQATAYTERVAHTDARRPRRPRTGLHPATSPLT